MFSTLKGLWSMFFGQQTQEEVKPPDPPSPPKAPLPKNKKKGMQRGRGKNRQKVQQSSPARPRRRLMVDEEGVRVVIVSKRRKRERASKEVKPSLKIKDEVIIRDFEDFHVMLSRSIDRFIPLELNKRCVRTILIWFWENEVIGENCYIPSSHLKKFVSKRHFSFKEFDECLRWLESLSFVLPYGGKGGAKGRLIFLNLKSQQGDLAVENLRMMIAANFYTFDRAVGR